MDEQKEAKGQVTFGSKYAGFMLVLDSGGPKMINGQYVPKTTFRAVTFSSGVYSTSDKQEIEEIRNHKTFGKDFWEISKPEDAKSVNVGRRLETTGGVKGTGSISGRQS